MIRTFCLLCYLVFLSACGDDSNPEFHRQEELQGPPSKTNLRVESPACYISRENQNLQEPNDEEPFRIQVKKDVWNYSIGQMMRSYLFKIEDVARADELAGRIADRVFIEPEKVDQRVTALRLLVEDLYDCRLMNEETESRIHILHTKIENEMAALNQSDSSFGRRLANALPYFIGVAVLSGSPQLRLQIWNVGKRAYSWIRSGFSSARASIGPMNATGISAKDFLKDYSLGHAYMMFMNLAMGYMVLDILMGSHEQMDMNIVYDLRDEKLLQLQAVGDL